MRSLTPSTQPHERSATSPLSRDLTNPSFLAQAETRISIDRARARSMINFVIMAWHVLEPATVFRRGWVIDAICDHLEAVTAGDIRRLLINVPPGSMKSLLTSVLWQAWEWGPKGMGHIKTVSASYEMGLSIRDARKLRMLVESDWYQARWPEVVMAHDQNQKTRFENTQTGFRAVRPITSLTGERGHRLTFDDPHSVKMAESDAQRTETVREFRESATSRLIDPVTSAIVVIMQRVHQKDVAGEIIESIGGYDHLVLPMEFEADRRCTTSIGFADPRTVEGELLFPERFPREVVDRDKKVLGVYATASQFQQRPSPREGGMFRKEWFAIVPAAPSGGVYVRKWDLAGTEKRAGNNPDWTVGLLMLKMPDGRHFVIDLVRLQGEPFEVEAVVKNTADQDRARYGGTVVQHLNIDPGQSGKSQRNAYAKLLAGHILKFEAEKGTKQYRAMAVSTQAQVGNICLVEGPWNGPFLEEMGLFPAGAHDDQVDALSGAYNCMNDPAAGQAFIDWLAHEVAAREAAKAAARNGPSESEMVLLRAPLGVSTASGRLGDAYSVGPDGLMRVRPEDAALLQRAGFERIDAAPAP